MDENFTYRGWVFIQGPGGLGFSGAPSRGVQKWTFFGPGLRPGLQTFGSFGLQKGS